VKHVCQILNIKIFSPQLEQKVIVIELPFTFLSFDALFWGILGFKSEQYFCMLDFRIFNLWQPLQFV